MMQKLKKSKSCLALALSTLIITSGMCDNTQAKRKIEVIETPNDIQTVSLEIVKVENTIPKLKLKQQEPIILYYIPEIPLSRELQKYTYDLCLEKDVDYDLVLAVMWRESRFELDATGYNSNGTQDSGVMQINDINKEWIAEELNVTDLYDPQQNILAGVTMLADFIDTYGEHDGLMAYGAGETGMGRLKNKGINTLNDVQIAFDKRDEIELMEKTE